MLYRNLIIFLFSLLPVSILFSQNLGISVSADKQKILLGEPFHLTLQAVYPSGLGVSTGYDSIPHFEFTEEPKIDSTLSNQLVTLNIVYSLTSFDSGHWVIPSLIMNKKWRADSIPMDVQFSEFDTSQPYHSIKDILDVAVKKRSDWWWYVMGGALLLIMGLVYFLKKRKRRLPIHTSENIDPYKEAMLELKKLSSENLEPKLYYSKLILVFRIYLKRKKNMQSLQKTTADLIIKMKELSLKREELELVSQALRMADVVKFARYIPEAADREASFSAIKTCIESIESASLPLTPA